MENQEILDMLVRGILIPIIPLITAYIVLFLKQGIDYLQEKSSNDNMDRYLDEIEKMLVKAVNSTTQTYVSTIKKQEGFLTKEQQLEALRLSKESFENSIGKDGKDFIKLIYGDYETWIQQSIEDAVGKSHIDYK